MSISYLLRRSGIFLALVRLPFRIMKRIGNKINTWWWKLHVLRLGRNSLVEMGVSIENPRQVAVGENCLICRDATLVSETIDGNLCLEDRVQINRGVKIDHTGGVLIREHSLISEGATIYSHTHGTDPHSIPKGIPKTIGPKVWIGAHALIMENCSSIGEGSVVAAASVVTKSIDPYVVVAGNPARVVRRLGND